jgi:hypothetical protein
MTRDEARKVIGELWKKEKTNTSSHDFYIDMFINLGMLKLDEPAPVKDRLRDQIDKTALQYGTAVVWGCIEAAGLKLVDK